MEGKSITSAPKSLVQNITSNFAIYRDDVFPFLGGGNKARKMMALYKYLNSNDVNAIVTTGGVQSNHCRAVALYCKKYNLKCTLVVHGDKERYYDESGNAKIIRETNAKVIFSEVDMISDTMDNAMNEYSNLGCKPFYLEGGGHTLQGGGIYIDAVEEIINTDFIPDYIFVASGSGTTQAGILAGITKFNLNTKVYGISVGRLRAKAEKKVQSFYNKLCEKYNIICDAPDIIVNDSFLCGGYEKYNSAIDKIAKDSLMNYGFAMDKTYTAKAYYGMQKIVVENKLSGKILFWNTGGMYNFLSK